MIKKNTSKPRSLYVIPIGNAWGVRREGNAKYTFITDHKREALIYAKEMAINNNTELIVYSKDGKVTERNNYRKTTVHLEKK